MSKKKKPATNYKKWIGYGVLGLGAYLLLFSGSTSYQETRMLGGGSGITGSPQETGYMITPTPNVTYNLGSSAPSEGFTYVSSSDSPTPFSAETPTTTSKKRSSSGSAKIATSPVSRNVYNPNTGVYTDKSGLGYSMASAPSGAGVIPKSNVFTNAVASNPSNLGVSSAYGSTVGEVAKNTKKVSSNSNFLSKSINDFSSVWGGK